LPNYFTDDKKRVRKIDESGGRPDSKSMSGGNGHKESEHDKFAEQRLNIEKNLRDAERKAISADVNEVIIAGDNTQRSRNMLIEYAKKFRIWLDEGKFDKEKAELAMKRYVLPLYIQETYRLRMLGDDNSEISNNVKKLVVEELVQKALDYAEIDLKTEARNHSKKELMMAKLIGGIYVNNEIKTRSGFNYKIYHDKTHNPETGHDEWVLEKVAMPTRERGTQVMKSARFFSEQDAKDFLKSGYF